MNAGRNLVPQRIVQQPLKRLVWFVAMILAGYLAVLGLIGVFGTEYAFTLTLPKAVDLAKFASLFALVIVGGELALHGSRTGGIFVANIFALVVSVLVLIVVALKLVFHLDFMHEVLGTNVSAKSFEYTLKRWSAYLSAAPLLIYLILNVTILLGGARWLGAEPNTKQRQKAFLITAVSHIAITVPLFAIVALVNMDSLGLMPRVEIETRDLFLGGAMAMAIFSSAFSTKAVELHYN